MIYKITVVGIRNYLKNGEDDYDELFSRLPVGSIVFLRIEPTGAPFPGSVSVWDEHNQRIGSISKTDRRYVELEIPNGEMLPVKVSGHSAEHNCIYVTVENTKGVKEPFIRNISLEEDETVFATTEHDMRLQQLTEMMKTQIKMLETGMTQKTDALMLTAQEYLQYCCTSLDGQTSFSRGDILNALSLLMDRHKELEPIYSAILELHKDIGRMYNDVKTQAYLEQYQRIKTSALTPNEHGRSQFDDYIRRLEFAHGGILSQADIDAEILNLSKLLANEMMKSYEKNTETDEAFATALYSLNYSMNAIYSLYSRQIKLEQLKRLKATLQSGDKLTIIYSNTIFNRKLFNTNAKVAKLRDAIGARIKGARLENEAQSATDRPQIDPTIKCQWYYIWKILAESNLMIQDNNTVRAFLRQMIDWYPEVFEELVNEKQKMALVSKMEKSISTEKDKWKLAGKEVPFQDMLHKWKELGLDFYKKVQPMFLVCKDLHQALQNL